MLHIKAFLSTIPKPVWVAILLSVLLYVCLMAFIVTHYNESVLIAGDGQVYTELALNLHNGHGFTLYKDGEYIQETFRTPGLPFLLMLFFTIGLGLKSYFVFISFLSAILIPLLSWYVAKTVFTEQVGVLTAFLLAVEPLLLLNSWTLITEIPFLILMLFASVLLIRAYKKHTVLSLDALGAGVLFGLSVYIRPAVFPILLIALCIMFFERSYVEKKVSTLFLFVGCISLLVLVPWYVHMHAVTGKYALSGTGWRNVYTDYLASIRTINNNSKFTDEKEALKQYAMKTWDIERYEINSPKLNDTFRAYALPEILDNKTTVVKLQSILFFTYFTHTDFQRKLQKIGILPMNKKEEGRVSSSRLVLHEGIYALPKIYKEMENRYFLPIIERLWSMSFFVLALLGFFVSKSRIRFLIFLLLLFGYLTSSAIGFGVESRLRMPVLPFYYMLVSCGMLFMFPYIKKVTTLWKK